jgi:hypothetical protein
MPKLESRPNPNPIPKALILQKQKRKNAAEEQSLILASMQNLNRTEQRVQKPNLIPKRTIAPRAETGHQQAQARVAIDLVKDSYAKAIEQQPILSIQQWLLNFSYI